MLKSAFGIANETTKHINSVDIVLTAINASRLFLNTIIII